jgi:hypothetical protein
MIIPEFERRQLRLRIIRDALEAEAALSGPPESATTVWALSASQWQASDGPGNLTRRYSGPWTLSRNGSLVLQDGPCAVQNTRECATRIGSLIQLG